MRMLPAIILVFAFAAAGLVYLAGRVHPRLRDVLAVLSSLVLVGVIGYGHGKWDQLICVPDFLGVELSLRLNSLGWFFAVYIALINAGSIVFSLSYMKGKERLNFYYSMMLLVNAGMLGVVLSGDFLSFYIFWETMSWSTYLLISYKRGPALHAGMKYIVMSLVGSCAMLVGILSLHGHYGTLEIAQLGGLLAGASAGYIVFLLLTMGIAFGIKFAILPLHTWMPDAHSEAVSPFSAVLSGVLVRMGMYGFLLIMYSLVGVKTILELGRGAWDFHLLFSWLGALTIVIPTFIALLQDDAKRLLAWHGIGQGGYMILGMAFGTSLGVAGGIFHTINHGSYIALLFLVVGAVEYRTGGVRDLNRLGGLMQRMPVAFLGCLVGIMGLIGIPLTNGFVSKWLIYKTLITEGRPFLAFMAFVGTWGTILSVYKLLHNMFLGQLPQEYSRVEKSPLSMQIPILFLCFVIFLFGILPGIPLRAIQGVQREMGFAPLELTLWGLASDVGALNMLNICVALVTAFAVVFLVMRVGPKGRRVAQDDSYAAGAYVPVDRYHHSVEFYNPLYRMISPYLKDRVDEFYYWIADRASGLFDIVRRMYTGYAGTYVLYIVAFLAFLILVQLVWQVW